jgi:phosphonopyruvate decarboxylase
VIQPADFYEALRTHGLTFFTGVPDSLLKDLCAFITDHVPRDHHVINANEGSAVGLAAGYHLATGQIPVVYLQNSGTGNVINPLLSLADPAVYGIPILFIIGWRGEPGVPDEPQHVAQGRAMRDLLRSLGVEHDLIDGGTENIAEIVRSASERMTSTRRSHVVLVRKNTFAPYALRSQTVTSFPLTSEQALQTVLAVLEQQDLIVSTTGMISREVFELRERQQQGHDADFLTVGSMGHCSQIAMGLAQHQPARQVFCLDGDGAVLMHMGSLAIIGTQGPQNFKHIVINNGAHNSVGGQPTAALDIDLCAIARGCGYRSAERATTSEDIGTAVRRLRKTAGPGMVEIRVNKRSRADLGRPTKTPLESKLAFMKALGHEGR